MLQVTGLWTGHHDVLYPVRRMHPIGSTSSTSREDRRRTPQRWRDARRQARPLWRVDGRKLHRQPEPLDVGRRHLDARHQRIGHRGPVRVVGLRDVDSTSSCASVSVTVQARRRRTASRSGRARIPRQARRRTIPPCSRSRSTPRAPTTSRRCASEPSTDRTPLPIARTGGACVATVGASPGASLAELTKGSERYTSKG